MDETAHFPSVEATFTPLVGVPFSALTHTMEKSSVANSKELYQTFKKEVTSLLCKLSENIKRGFTSQLIFSVNLDSKPNKNSLRKENYPHEHECKTLSKLSAN